MEINLYRAPDGFVLLAGDADAGAADEPNVLPKNYQIQIQSISLHVTRHTLNRELTKSINSVWPQNPIPYSFKRILPLSKLEVTKEMLELNTNLAYGQRPALLFCVFVDGRAMRGDIKFNPNKLEHMFVKECSCTFENKRYPSIPFKSSFAPVGNKNYAVMDLYVSFLKALGMYNGTQGNGLSLDDFVGGNTVFSFILSQQDLISGSKVATPELGYTTINFTFGEAPTNNCEMWAFGVYNSTIHLTRNYEVLSDYIAGNSS